MTIAEELQQTRNYLDIQMIRYPNKFSVDFCCDETLMKYQVLRLIIQPLVENSLQHGILQQEKYGLLRIRLSRRGELLRFVITDNGVGMNQMQIKHLHSQMNTDGVSDLEGRHIGLRNTFKRLKLKYGDQASLYIRSKPGLGTSIVLELPILLNDDIV